MDPNTTQSENLSDDQNMDELADMLDDDVDTGADPSGDEVEDPAPNAGGQEPNQEEEEDGEGLDELEDLDPEGEDPEGEEEEGEEGDDPEKGSDSKAVKELQHRVDVLTGRAKTAEERVSELEGQLEEAKATTAAPRTPESPYQDEKQIDEREATLRQSIRGLRDLVDGEPTYTNDPVSGERVENMVTIGKQLPSAWKSGTAAHRTRLELLKEFPGLTALGDQAVVEATLGRMYLRQQAKNRKAKGTPPKQQKGPKSGSRVPPNTRTNTTSKEAIMNTMDVPDDEMAELAAML